MPASSRMLFRLTLATLMLPLYLCAQAGASPSWEQYKGLFVAGDGRVIDYGQSQVSTSESQGYGMLLSVFNNDRKTFESIWSWARANLAVRKDGLMAWLWGKRPNGRWEVMDYNNATDGDTLMAFSLLKASKQWDNDGYRVEALQIIRSMREKLAVRHNGSTYLLPGYYGFAENGSITLNPSYLIFPAYRFFAKVDDKSFWDDIQQDSMKILDRACLGSPCLPADWVKLENNVLLQNEDKFTRFGYDAVRVLLHMAWEGLHMPEGINRILKVYKKEGYIPLWLDLKTNEKSNKSAHAGIYAVYGLAASRSGDEKAGRKLLIEAKNLLQSEERNYYSYSLYLLSRIEDPI